MNPKRRGGPATKVQLVMECIRMLGPVSVADIIKHTGFHQAIVSSIVSKEHLHHKTIRIGRWWWTKTEPRGYYYLRPQYVMCDHRKRDARKVAGNKKPEAFKVDGRKAPNPLRSWRQEQILALIQEHGPITLAKLGLLLEAQTRSVQRALTDLRRAKRIYIHHYTRELQPGRRMPRPVAAYSVGSRVDAKKPPPLTTAEYSERARSKAKRFTPSVFHLGKPQQERRVGSFVFA